MSIKNARTLGLRIDAADNAILVQFEAETHLEAVSLLRAAFKAALKRYKEKGSLTVPLYVVDDIDFKTLLRQKLLDAAPATSLIVLTEDSQPTIIASIPPPKDVSYDSGKKRTKKNGTED
jgi:hypothetical protein